MKTSIYFFFLLFTSGLIGQPTISSDAIVDLGEDEPTSFLAFQQANWQSGNAGTDILWDFSSLSMGAECEYLAMAAADAPYFDSFPNSDIYFVCTFSDSQGFEVENYTFYNINNDVLQLAGNVSISVTNPAFDSIFTVFTDPLDWATFPYFYGALTDDTFAARITSYLGEQTIVAHQEGTSTHQVDSYGTLSTPAGTFEDVLRVKRVEIAENSIPGIPFSTPQESYRYTWYAENENGVILNLDSIVVKDFMGNVVSTELTGSYRTAGPTSTSVSEAETIGISIFPNPAIDQITIHLVDISEYKLYIYTADGKSVPYSTISDTRDSRRLSFDSKNREGGLYFVKILDKNNELKYSKSIVVSH